MVMPMATGNKGNRKLLKLLSRAGAKNSTVSDIEKLVEVIAFGNNTLLI